METKRIEFPLPSEHYNKLLFNIQKEGMAFQLGTVRLAKGTRLPETGFTRHPEHEISIVQKGKIEMLNEDGGVMSYLNTGEVVYIEALEAQAGNILENTEIIYFLIKDQPHEK